MGTIHNKKSDGVALRPSMPRNAIIAVGKEEIVVRPQPDFDHAREYALTRLANELPAYLSYHSLYHTRDDVLPAAERLARLEGVSPTDFMLLQTAVLYHDIGFIRKPEDHEQFSAQAAALMLPRFGYTDEQIDQICDMILATKVFTPPKSQLEAIIVDADLDVLGREDFFARNQDLRHELATLGKDVSDEQWYLQQLKFMRLHQYRTISAQALRNPRKEENISTLSSLLKACNPKVVR